jgi:hypothetical protein
MCVQHVIAGCYDADVATNPVPSGPCLAHMHGLFLTRVRATQGCLLHGSRPLFARMGWRQTPLTFTDTDWPGPTPFADVVPDPDPRLPCAACWYYHSMAVNAMHVARWFDVLASKCLVHNCGHPVWPVCCDAN